MSTTESTSMADRPWRDPEVLRDLYLEQDLDRREVADRLDCSKGAVDDWLNRYSITKTDREPWHDAAELRRLYHDEGLTQREIAAHFECSSTTITEAMARYDIAADTSRRGDRRYSDADLVAFLRELDADLDHRPRKIDAKRADGPAATTICDRFGGWYDALEAADIEVDRPSGADRETLEDGQGALLRANRAAALSLRDAPEPFLFADVGFDRRMLAKFKAVGLISHADDTRVSNPHTDTRSKCWPWSVADGVREWIDAHVSPRGECPREGCEATGVRNLGDGRFTCTSEDCSSRFDEAAAREVLGG